ncbi:MAG: RNA methyltransferase [Acidobacteria bacterium]|nr:RNA methyltransferase [Acidobacteriota bacterium]
MHQAPAVILVRPTEEGNVGAVARAMANTGLDRLILVEPAVRIGAKARARAVGGAPILEAAKRSPSLTAALASFRHVVGTSSHRERSFKSRTIDPRKLPERLASGDPRHAALVFGPERSGLTTEELALCATVVRIPTASEQPTLNLAQAVLIVAYELFLAREVLASEAAPANQSTEATAGDIGGLFERVDSILHTIGFARDTTYEGVLLDLRRLAGRARLTDREVVIFRGLCRRLEHLLARRGGESA